MDESIVKAIMDCAHCKNFRGTHLHSLLQLIIRHHPSELLVGDYLSLPVSKGGYHMAGIYLDTCSQHVWGYKFKTHRTVMTTNRSINDIFHNFTPPETFMADGGKHFKNWDIEENCECWGTKLHMVAAYSPWVNSLVEGTNKLLLYVLARLCAPEVGEDGWEATMWDKLPTTWPDHFDKAIHILNWRILPALKFCLKKILLGLVVNTSKMPVEVSSSFLPPSDIDNHMMYAAQQQLDGYAEAVQCKTAFDRRVTKSGAGMVEFKKGQLVQVYRNKVALKLSTECKLVPLWSSPHHVTEHLLNSYRLKTLEGVPLDGLFNVRCLRGFSPKEGTKSAMQQKTVEEWLASQESEAGDPMVTKAVVPPDGGNEEMPDDGLEELDLGGLGLEDLEVEIEED